MLHLNSIVSFRLNNVPKTIKQAIDEKVNPINNILS